MIFIFMTLANFSGNFIMRFAVLLIQETQVSSGNELIIILLATIIVFLKFIILHWLFNKFPRDYDQHTLAIWIFAILPTVGYKLYIQNEFSDISNVLYPNMNFVLDLMGNVILAGFITDSVLQKAGRLENERIRNRQASHAGHAKNLPRPVMDKASDLQTNDKPAHLTDTLSHLRVLEDQKDNKASNTVSAVDDEIFYKLALEECDNDEKVAKTWAKALTICKGNVHEAKWEYVTLRVKYLSEKERL